MAQIERQPVYQPTTEAVVLKIDQPVCIGCGEYALGNAGVIPLEAALKMLLCEKCKATLQAFRYLAEPSINDMVCSCPAMFDAYGKLQPRVFGYQHEDNCPKLAPGFKKCICPNAKAAVFGWDHIESCPHHEVKR